MHNIIYHCKSYTTKLHQILESQDWKEVEKLAETLFKAWQNKKRVYICGNGGSAGNAIHLANDFLYGVAKDRAPGFRVMALTANSAVLTCLANDISYDEVFAQQLNTMGEKGDVLIILSGSGNSENVIRALQVGNQLGMQSYAILGFSGGKCKEIAKTSIHFAIDDMQIAEDLQLIVGHMLMQHLYERIYENSEI